MDPASIRPPLVTTGWTHGCSSLLGSWRTSIRPVSVGDLDSKRAESDVDRLGQTEASATDPERVLSLDQTIPREDNPLVCAAYNDAVASRDENGLLYH